MVVNLVGKWHYLPPDSEILKRLSVFQTPALGIKVSLDDVPELTLWHEDGKIEAGIAGWLPEDTLPLMHFIRENSDEAVFCLACVMH